MLLVGSQQGHDRHDTGQGHPERAARVPAAEQGLLEGTRPDQILRLPPRRASREELAAVHDPAYLDALIAVCADGGGRLDPDTVLSAGSWETADYAAGAGLAAVSAIDAGAGSAAMLLTRPPGHHAGRATGSGFCLLNHIAVTAAALRGRGERVAIIDWDVHHGNGTQDIFYDDAYVLYLSVHQWPMYPGTGRPTERGGAGTRTTLNAPLPPHSSGPAYRAVFDDVFAPIVDAFSPTWVLVSAGFDAHRDDPLADMELTSGDYADLTARVVRMAGGSPVVLFLEGGYDLDAITNSVAACAAGLLGNELRPEPASTSEVGLDRAAAYGTALADGW